MSLIDDLRNQRAQVIADALEQAHDYWPMVEKRMRETAARGGTPVILRPVDNSPLERATAAAIATKAALEGFKTERIPPSEDSLATALGGSPDIVTWKLSW